MTTLRLSRKADVVPGRTLTGHDGHHHPGHDVDITEQHGLIVDGSFVCEYDHVASLDTRVVGGETFTEVVVWDEVHPRVIRYLIGLGWLVSLRKTHRIAEYACL